MRSSNSLTLLAQRFFAYLPPCSTIDSLLIIGLFLASRLVLFSLGLRPNIEHLSDHWQYIDLSLLQVDYLGSLTLLHSQPPLWNAILGLLLFASNGNIDSFSLWYVGFSLVLSLAIALIIYFTLLRLAILRWIAVGSSTVYILASSAYFYENLIFYPLFTAFLAVCFMSTVAFAFSSNKRSTVFCCSSLACLCLVLLSLTWTLFHPYIVIATSCFILYKAYSLRNSEKDRSEVQKSRFTYVVTSCFIIALTLVVPLKNKVLFDNLGSGSWMGMNLAQVSPSVLVECDFGAPLTLNEVEAAKSLTSFTSSSKHPILLSAKKNSDKYPNLNNIGYIIRSNQCSSLAMQSIINDLPAYASSSLTRFLRSHLRLSDSFLAYPIGMGEDSAPIQNIANTRNIVFLPVVSSHGNRHLAPLLIPVAFLTGAFFLFYSEIFRDSLSSGVFAALCSGLWITVWIYAVGYLFNGGEQERMRFTIEPLFICWFATFMQNMFVFLRRKI